MRSVTEVRSAEGSYFVIGKNDDGYYLRNLYTEIPNEFGMYNIEEVQSLFDGLCDRIPECKETDHPYGHPNSCMRVIYSDGAEQLYKETEQGLNLCAFTARAAQYSEFFGSVLFFRSELITLDHLRKVCSEKEERFEIFITALKDYLEDDYLTLVEEIQEDGSIRIRENVYSNVYYPVTINPDGYIEETGNIKFVELMKRNNVRIIK